MSTLDITVFREILTTHGYHVTKTREATFRLLASPEPLTMNQILKKAAGTIDRVTVYRTIDLFEKLGIVHRIQLGWKYKLELSDQFMSHHHHLTCLGCGDVTDIEDEQHIDTFIHEVADRFGFTPRRHQFEIDGYCKNCQEATSKKTN